MLVDGRYCCFVCVTLLRRRTKVPVSDNAAPRATGRSATRFRRTLAGWKSVLRDSCRGCEQRPKANQSAASRGGPPFPRWRPTPPYACRPESSEVSANIRGTARPDGRNVLTCCRSRHGRPNRCSPTWSTDRCRKSKHDRARVAVSSAQRPRTPRRGKLALEHCAFAGRLCRMTSARGSGKVDRTDCCPHPLLFALTTIGNACFEYSGCHELVDRVAGDSLREERPREMTSGEKRWQRPWGGRQQLASSSEGPEVVRVSFRAVTGAPESASAGMEREEWNDRPQRIFLRAKVRGNGRDERRRRHYTLCWGVLSLQQQSRLI